MNEWQRIIRKLERKGLTGKEIADKLDISPGALCDLKKGRSKEPRLRTALRMREVVRE